MHSFLVKGCKVILGAAFFGQKRLEKQNLHTTVALL